MIGDDIRGYFANVSGQGNFIYGGDVMLECAADEGIGWKAEVMGVNNNARTYGMVGIGEGGDDSNYGVVGLGSVNDIPTFGGQFGVYGEVEGDDNPSARYAIFGQAGGAIGSGSNYYAGYFNGQVISTVPGNVTSDRRFKEDVKAEVNASDLVNLLNPVNYYFNSKEEFSHIHLDRGRLHHGFIAQELQEVLPELVSENVHPAVLDSNGKVVKEKVDYLGVNYIGLISLLTKAIQEQDARIDSLIAGSKGREDQTTGIEEYRNETKETLRLGQNRPNPYESITTIDIIGSKKYASMELWITNLEGRLLDKKNIGGMRQVKYNRGQLGAGIYIYSLVVDGNIVDSKRMVVE